MKTTPFKYLIEAIAQKEKALKKIIEKRHGVGTAPSITIQYDLNSSRALGTYQFSRSVGHLIRLNCAMLNELKEKYIDDVFVHEYAHACVQHFIGSHRGYKKVMPHGIEFKSYCYAFGIDGGATTSVASGSKALQDAGRNTKKHSYTCGCQDFQLSTQRHNKILRGASYCCKRCGKKLTKKH